MIGIKPGYKQTDVGLIPEDWEVDFLLNKVSLIHGKAHEKAICDDGNYIVVNSKFISSEAKVKKYSKDNFCKAKIGDVLMVLSDLPNGKALAKCFHVEENEVYAVNQRVCIYRSKVIESKYLYYVLNRKRSFLDLDDGVTQTHILNGDIKKCIFQFPKIAEQKAISNVLCDVEKLIEGLQKLIKKKCDMKIATMQQLLTARKRLPGFNDIWEELQIKEFTHCVAGGTPSTLIKEYWDGEIFWMSSGELNNKFIYNVSGRITDLGLKNSSTSMVPEKCVLVGLAGQGKTRGTAAINYHKQFSYPFSKLKRAKSNFSDFI